MSLDLGAGELSLLGLYLAQSVRAQKRRHLDSGLIGLQKGGTHWTVSAISRN